MIRAMVPLGILLLAGCANGSKHETLTLQCLGLCALSNINHESERVKPAVPPTKENQNE